MNGDAVIEIDALLRMVEAMRTSENELIKLEKAGHAPDEIEGYYLAAQQILVWRTDSNPNAKKQIEELGELAALDSVALPQPNIETPVVHVPIFAIGL